MLGAHGPSAAAEPALASFCSLCASPVLGAQRHFNLGCLSLHVMQEVVVEVDVGSECTLEGVVVENQ